MGTPNAKLGVHIGPGAVGYFRFDGCPDASTLVQQCPPFCEEFSAQGPGEASLLEEPPVCPDGFEAQLVLGAELEFVWLEDVPVGYVDAGTVYFVHADHLNTPRVVTTTAGTAVWSWAFQGNPFGENAPNEDVDGDLMALAYPLRFPGQYDDGAGVFYNYYRDYEPGAARYASSDPIGLAGGRATYAYGAASPLRYADPTGLLVPGPSCTGECATAVSDAENLIRPLLKQCEDDCYTNPGKVCMPCKLVDDVLNALNTSVVEQRSANGRVCGGAKLGVPKVWLYGAFFTDPDCTAPGCQVNTIFHELLHVAKVSHGGANPSLPDEIADKCFPCQEVGR